jgi:type II secretory pathway component PulC
MELADQRSVVEQPQVHGANRSIIIADGEINRSKIAIRLIAIQTVVIPDHRGKVTRVVHGGNQAQEATATAVTVLQGVPDLIQEEVAAEAEVLPVAIAVDPVRDHGLRDAAIN